MAKIPLKFVEFSQPLFLNGNFGVKVSPQTKPGVILQYDDEKNWIEVVYMGTVSVTHVSAVHSFQPANPIDLGIKIEAKIQTNQVAPLAVTMGDLLAQKAQADAKGIKTAQVSNPTKPLEGVSVQGKPKAISHAQLKAQQAAEEAQTAK